MLRYCLKISLEQHKTDKSIRQEVNAMNVSDLMKRGLYEVQYLQSVLPF